MQSQRSNDYDKIIRITYIYFLGLILAIKNINPKTTKSIKPTAYIITIIACLAKNNNQDY